MSFIGEFPVSRTISRYHKRCVRSVRVRRPGIGRTLQPSTLLLPAASAAGLFRDSRREQGSDRQLFLQAVWTGPVLLDPSLLGVGLEGRRNFALKRPKIGRHLVNGDF